MSAQNDPVNRIFEELAIAECEREKKSWFMSSRDEKKFYLDRVKRIVAGWEASPAPVSDRDPKGDT